MSRLAEPYPGSEFYSTMPELRKIELEILKILYHEDKPLGSGQLRSLLAERGFRVSEATAGRALSALDQKGLTVKHGFKGRVISATGKKAVEEAEKLRRQELYGARFINILNSQRQEDLIEMLEARRAIERELARLAAINATEGEIELLKAILLEQEQLAARNEMSAEHDLKFHRLIAQAAKNKVLAAALELIRQSKQMAMILEYIRKEVKGTLAVEHANILKAIINRDPDEAERAMIAHIESLISDVIEYWKKKNHLESGP